MPEILQPLQDWADRAQGQAQEGAALCLHATALALDGRGILLLGPSGSGKSRLALALLGHGARLICDDGVEAQLDGDGIALLRPKTATDLIEARGVGLLHGGLVVTRAELALVVDLARPEPERLPPRRMVAMAGRVAPLILGGGQPELHHAIIHMLRFGRVEP